MKNLYKPMTVQFFVAATMVFRVCVDRCLAEDVGNKTGFVSPLFMTSSCTYLSKYPGGACVLVYIHFTPPNTNVNMSPFLEAIRTNNHIVVVSDPIRDGKYYVPTNSFCGFVELRAANGKKIELLKPEVNSAEAYPATYSLLKMSEILNRHAVLEPTMPRPISGNDPEFCIFHLKDYFKYDNVGNYQLTVCPKIYKRSATNDDLCERLDLPPVTISIKWNGDSSD